MPLPSYNSTTNGHGPDHEASPYQDGAFHLPGVLEAPANLVKPRRARTVFPTDAPADAWRALLYNAYCHEVGAIRFTRWMVLLLLLVAGIWATGWLPGRWWISGGAVALALLLIGAVIGQRRRDFVRFEAEPLPEVAPRKLSPSDKIPVYVTGHFAVEGQYARFTALPGFFRTFATREHALLCLVRSRRFARVAIWPPEQTGMWYIFFTPTLVRQIRYGRLHFSRAAQPAVAIDYEMTFIKPGRTKAQVVEETVYIASERQADVERILADLLLEAPTALATSRAAARA